MNRLRRFHLVIGVAVLLVFLATGAYMKLVARPERLGDGAHMMFVSRHIYILANSLVHLCLGAYAAPHATSKRRAWQWIGSGLLVGSSVLLITAFVYEPVAGNPRTFVSSFGIFLLLGGSLLHFLTALRANN